MPATAHHAVPTIPMLMPVAYHRPPSTAPSVRLSEAELWPTPWMVASTEGCGVQLLSRMVVSNGPWRFFLNFKGIIATAFATGAYALIFPTVWQLGDAIAWPRLTALMLISITVMVFWMIVAHSLWERSSDTPELNERVTPAMQNAVTLITLILAVLIAYAVLFGLIFAAAIVGGLGNPMGAIAGGFLIAFSEVALTYPWKKVAAYLGYDTPGLLQLLSTEYKFAVSFVILIVVSIQSLGCVFLRI